jgi:ribosomal protein L37E
MKEDTKQPLNSAECGNKSKPMLANRCSFKPYGEEENICTKCGYVTWSSKTKTYEEIVQQMIDSGYPSPDCYNVC